MLATAVLGLFLAAGPSPELDGSLPPIPEKFRRRSTADISSAAWAVADAPYRAIVTLNTLPTAPAAGVEIEIPEFGATMLDLSDVVMLDSKGEAQPVAKLSRLEGKTVLLLAKNLEMRQMYYIYFGGGKRRECPAWKPTMLSLILETRRASSAAEFKTAGELEAAWNQAAGKVDGMGFVQNIYYGTNPYGPSSQFLSHFTGYLNTTGMKQLTLFTQSSDASFVFVNGQYVFGWPGKHEGRANEKNVPQKTIQVSGALTRIDYYHAKGSELKNGEETNPIMVLGWSRDKKLHAISADAWIHAGKASVLRIEAQNKHPAPVPNVSYCTYIGHNNLWFFETRFWMPTPPPEDWTVEWKFTDGTVRKEPVLTRILTTHTPQKVTLTLKHDNEIITGMRVFQPPDALLASSINKPGDTARYAETMGQDDPSKLSQVELKNYAFFLGLFGTLQQATRVAEAYIKNYKDTADIVWAECEAIHLRNVAQTNPQQALNELRALPPARRVMHATRFDPLEAELLVFYRRDLTSAGRLEQMASQNKDAAVAQVLRVRLGDLYRVAGRSADAIEKYRVAQRSVVDATGGRKLPAQDEAFSLSITEALAHDQREEAEKHLQEWERIHPMAKLGTDFLILRAQWLNKVGRYREALVELESFKGLSPESPYLVDADFYRGIALWETNQKDEARKIWAEIIKKYPKHPLVTRAEELVRQP